MTKDIKVEVTTARQAKVTAILGRVQYLLQGKVFDGQPPCIHVSAFDVSGLFFNIPEADWQQFRDTVDKLFAALKAA